MATARTIEKKPIIVMSRNGRVPVVRIRLQKWPSSLKKEYPDGRHALSWDELRTLDRSHVVASHTRSHAQVSLDDPVRLEDEIVGSQRDLVRELGHPVRGFAWLFGGRYGENPAADVMVDRAGYEFLFSNLALQRLPGVRPRK